MILYHECGGAGARRVLDLFSGIGGFALAFEAAGFQTVAFAEIEPYPCRVLAQHWPDVPNLGDVREVDGGRFAGVDVVCGGFPCQDISTAGKGAGIHGERSSLWFEMLRIIRGARPRFCLLENVPALRTRGADVVLEGLEEAGYAARPFVVGAGNAGAPHQRARVWVVAYDKSQSLGASGQPWERAGMGSYCNHDGRQRAGLSSCERQEVRNPCRIREEVGALGPDPDQGRPRCGRERPSQEFICCGASQRAGMDSDACSPQLEVGQGVGGQWPHAAITRSDWWSTEPAMGRVVHGLSNRAHRIKALGNSIVPAVAYPFAIWIGMQLDTSPRHGHR